MTKRYLYFIRTKGQPYCKIGIGNPQIRLRDCQTGCPHKLELWFTWQPPGQYNLNDIENGVHRLLSDHRATGGREWFKLSPGVEYQLNQYYLDQMKILVDLGLPRHFILKAEPGNFEMKQ